MPGDAESAVDPNSRIRKELVDPRCEVERVALHWPLHFVGATPRWRRPFNSQLPIPNSQTTGIGGWEWEVGS